MRRSIRPVIAVSTPSPPPPPLLLLLLLLMLILPTDSRFGGDDCELSDTFSDLE
jgi:hypothetical protein